MTVASPAPPDLLSADHIADPWPGLAILRDHYPVVWYEPMESWLISRYADIRPLNRAFGPGPGFQELLGQYLGDRTVFPAMDGPQHRRGRALLAPFFARGGVERVRDSVERQARKLLDPIFARERSAVAAGERQRGEIDFVTEFSAKFPVHVICDMLALSENDFPRMREWFQAWVGAEGNIARDPALFERALRAKEDFGEYMLPIVAERRSGDGDDLISRLCRAELDGFSLDDEDIRSISALTILGGGETTDHQLAWLLHELVLHPSQQRAFAEDRGLMDKVLAEGMRYCSIIQYSARDVREDLEIEGAKIEAGAPLVLALAAGNHDPRRFENADEFDIFRTDHDAAKAFTGSAQHLGFGGGSHFCIGSHISKAEMEVALSVFLDNASDIRFADGFEPTASRDAVFTRSLDSLKLSFALS